MRRAGSRLFVLVLSIAWACYGARAQDAAQRPRTGGSAPAVSPDGSRIALLSDKDGTLDVYTIAADGTAELRLTRTPAEEGRPRWSADGTRVQFSEFEDGVSRLMDLAADGSDRRQLAVVEGRSPILLPDGEHLIYSTGDWTSMQLTRARRDGSQARRVSDGRGAVWNAAPSPDGRRIAYTRTDVSRSMQVWEMKVDGSRARALTKFAEGDGRPQAPAWSPSGRRIAIHANGPAGADPSKRTAHIWIIELATGKASRLATHAESWLDEMPAWFPDGKRVAFQSNRSGRMEIWVMGADGSDPRQVTK